jgi:ferric-dicitrate binding protein FerR (iron transport regulator)
MEEQRLTFLLERYQAGAATPEELRELSNMLKTDTDSDLFRTVLAEMMSKEAPVLPMNQDRWQKMARNIVNVDKGSGAREETQATRVIRIFPWAGAAAAVLLIVLGGYFWMDRGQRTSLAKGEAVIRDSMVSTARGELREVILPDGSHIWLNSSSSIRWAVPFDEKERSVELSGEAFFDVRHADEIPFLIHSGAVTTSVLGTSFDVTAYPYQKNMTVSVKSGKVKVQAGDKVLAILEKGRQVRVGIDTIPYQKNIDTPAIAAWRTGNLVYKDETLEDIAADLQRVFNDSVEIKNVSLKGTMITLSLDKRMGIRGALGMICRTTDSRLSSKDGIFTIE